MGLSNSVLMVLVIGVLTLSVLGTVFNLKSLGSAEPIGFASSDTGTVTLTIAQTASLVLDDDTIDFGTCTTDSIASFSTYNSSVASGGENNSLCSNNASLPDSMTIRNAGGIDINVSMNVSMNGSTMFNSDSSKWYYQLTNGGGTSCNQSLQNIWTAVDDPLTDLPVCAQLLTYSRNGNINATVIFNFGAHVAMGGYNTGSPLQVIFEATAV